MRSTIMEATRRVSSRRTAAVAIGVIMAVAASTTAASATEHTATAKPHSVIQPNGVGYANSVAVPTVMRSNPTNSTEAVGTAQPGDNIADICWVSGSGGFWDLVLERTGAGGDHFSNTAAFLPEANLSDSGHNQATSCNSLSNVNTDTSVNHEPATLWAAAWSSSATVGNAYSGDVLEDLCRIQSGDGSWWDLTIDLAGHAGDHLPNLSSFIPETSLNAYQTYQCGQS